MRFFDDDDHDKFTIRAQNDVDHSLPSESQPATLENSTDAGLSLREFEATLEKTSVYRRVQSYESDVSFRTSVIRPYARSMMAKLSLDDISVVSVIAMPITLDDINSIGPQLTFSNIVSKASEEQVLESGYKSQQLSPPTGTETEPTVNHKRMWCTSQDVTELASDRVPRPNGVLPAREFTLKQPAHDVLLSMSMLSLSRSLCTS